MMTASSRPLKISQTSHKPLTARLTEEQQKLVRDHTSLVQAICSKLVRRLYIRKTVDFADLLQEGFLGLCVAATRWKENGNTKFSTFAWHYIRGYIMHFLRDKSRLVRLDQKLQAHRINIHKLEAEGKTEEEVMEILNLSPHEFWLAKLSFLETYDELCT